jgi:hypothetical protein
MNPVTAREISTVAHAGQVDKSGNPYIDHVARVATRVASWLGPQHQAVAVAWLHDVVEDTATSMDYLASQLTPEQLTALDALTHRDGEPREDYISRILQHPWARVVKRADIADNCSPERLDRLDTATRSRLERKYLRDLEQLGTNEHTPNAK